MSKYAIRFLSHTPASLGDRASQQTSPLPAWKFHFEGSGASVIISDQLETHSDINLHKGLRMVCDVDAASEEEAEKSAKGYCELLLNLVAFVTQASSLPAELDMTITTSDEALPFKSISQHRVRGASAGPMRQIKQETFEAVFAAFNAESLGRDRISRALSWLRKGLNERDAIDEFLSYWVGVEILSALLRDRMKMKVKSPGQWSGVENIFATKIAGASFSDIEEARNQLLHGYRELSDEFMAEIISYRAPMRGALLHSVVELLNLPESIEQEILVPLPLRAGGRVWSVSRGSLSGIPAEFDALAAHFPHIDPNYTEVGYVLDGEGKLQKNCQVDFKYKGPESGRFHIASHELHGDDDAGIESGNAVMTQEQIDKIDKSV